LREEAMQNKFHPNSRGTKLTTRTPLTANTSHLIPRKQASPPQWNAVGKWDSVFFSVPTEVESLVVKSHCSELAEHFSGLNHELPLLLCSLGVKDLYILFSDFDEHKSLEVNVM
jgi:hypothetical protein